MNRQEKMAALAGKPEAPAVENADLEGDAPEQAVAAEPAPRTQARREVKEHRTRTRGLFNGTALKLGVLAQIPGHKMRWVNDTEGRLELRQEGGWDFVVKGEVPLSASLKVLTNGDAVDNRIRRLVGDTNRGDPMYGYLMKIKDEWYDEDLEDYKTKVQETENALVRSHGTEGSGLENAYIPNQQKQALSIRRGRPR